MAKVFASVSHKGGTGRSVATANIAYRAALQGKKVCVVDLDLDSPTFPSILKLSGYETGSDIGIRHMFAYDPELRRNPIQFAEDNSLRIDVWEEAGDGLGENLSKNVGEFFLIAGSKDVTLRVQPHEEMWAPLRDLLFSLDAKYDFVFLDVSAGVSDMLEVVEMAVVNGAPFTAWLLFFRWTPQHLAAAAKLRNHLLDPDGSRGASATKKPVEAICTAFRDSTDLSRWVKDQDERLETQFHEEFGWTTSPSARIPYEMVLQWDECVLRDDDGKGAQKRTLKSLDALAERLASAG